MRLELHVNTENETFGLEGEDEYRCQIELARILTEVGDKIRHRGYELGVVSRILDTNGNRVGYWIFTDAPLG